MKKLKRLLALALAVTMLAGLVPANVIPVEAMSWGPTKKEQTQNQVQTLDAEAETRAVSDVVDAALFFSDLHTEKNNYKDNEIKAVMKGVAQSGLYFSSVTSVGDAFSSENTAYTGTTSKITESIRNGLGDSTVPVFYAWSDHDRGADIDNYTGLMYGDDKANAKYYDAEANYYIYTISMSDMSSAERYGVSSTFTENKLTKFTEVISGLDHSKPLFIATHQPLHDRRDDNEYADKWYGVISAAAEMMDIAVFWGHNHTSETNVDREAYYIAKDGTETMTIEGVGKIVPNFTYLNAGYMNNSRYNADSTREYVSTAVAIYKDTINYTLYDETGVYDGSDSLNENVVREFAVSEEPENPETPDVPEDTAIPEGYVISSLVVSDEVKTNYFVGEEFAMDSLKVQAVYIKEGNEDFVRDIVIAGETEDGYTVSGFDTAAAGTYTVTVSYEGLTTSFDIEVFEKTISDSNTGVSIETTVAGAVQISVNTVDTTNGVIATAVSEVLENYVGYDIKLDGHHTGDVVKVTLPVPEGVTNPKVYYVSDDGSTVTNMNAVKSEDGTTVTFETDHFSTYLVGEGIMLEVNDPNTVKIPDVIVGEPRTVYVLHSSAPEAGKAYLIANSNSASSTTRYLLANNGGVIKATDISIKSDDLNNDNSAETYIELDDVTDELWMVSGNYTFQNDKHYLGYTTSTNNWGQTNYTFGLSTESRSWNYDLRNHRLSTKVESGRNNIYYLRYNDEWNWTTNTMGPNANGREIYFYIPTEVAKIETYGAAYSIAGNPSKISKVVLPEAETALESILTINSNDPNVDDIETALTTEVTYEVVGGGDPSKIIKKIEGNKVIFTGAYGTALVKVSYKVPGAPSDNDTVFNYIEIEAKEPTDVSIDITHDHDKDAATAYEPVTKTIVIKQVTNTTTYDLDCTGILGKGDDATEFTPTVKWSTNKPDLAVVDENGLVTFKEANGTVQITAEYTYGNGTVVKDYVTFSISVGEYIMPGDGTDAFPEYPNEGSVRFDKTAQAVGRFSETGIAQLELSMTGVPFTSENRMDVVLMLDRSSSMYKIGVQHRISSTVEATKAFIENIVMNEDGSFNNNRIMVMDFLGGNLDSSEGGGSTHKYQSNLYTTNEESGYQVINNQAELDALLTKIVTDFKGQTSLYGTEYAQGLEGCYNALHASKDDGNKQFCVFMSDGIPNYMMGETTHFEKTDSIVGMFDVTDSNSANATVTRDTEKYEYEHYSTQMKNEGVTVFTVGLGLQNTNSAWSGASKEACEQVANILLNDISGPAGEQVADRDKTNTVSKLNKYFFSVADDNAAENMKNVFSGIAQKILEAAKDVRVTDKIADEYTMVFDFPNDTVAGKLTQTDENGKDTTPEFYIEALEYDLTPVEDSNGTITDYKRSDNPTSLLRVYLGEKTDEDGNVSYYAAKAAATADAPAPMHDIPTFSTTPLGTKYYWTTDASKGDQNIALAGADGIIYYFVARGDGSHNMVAGAYAYGTPVTTNIEKINKENNKPEVVGSNTTCQNLIIATPYFVYNADTRMLVWTAEKLSTKELALTYFLYLDNSGGYVGNEDETDEGTYPTNDYALLDYTNFQGVECEQVFPIPQMTWNGAQVSYVFYLVNEDGVPVNRAGRKIPFSEAVYVTDVFTYSEIWNTKDENADGQLTAEYLAKDKVPDVYTLYDELAEYDIRVFETEEGQNKNNHFIIKGGEKPANTTYVFNTKSDLHKYNKQGTYDEGDVHTGFDFANTTVAFAVLWSPKLVEDTVVIDYGLPVDIDVVTNDNVLGKLVGLQGDSSVFGEPNSENYVAINTGQITDKRGWGTQLLPDGYSGMQYGKVELFGEKLVRYTPLTMNMPNPEVFYYISEFNYYDSDNVTIIPSRMYSSVTVIPATSIYYEDSFVSFNHGVSAQSGLTETDTPNGTWIKVTDGIERGTVTQQQDRPGASDISAALDADNVYGYDKAYAECSEYSLGSAQKVTVSDYNNPNATYHPDDAVEGVTASWPTAIFSFTGAGFDIISLTSNKTGLIKVNVTGTTLEGELKKYNWIVDTFYGYEYKDTDEDGVKEWVVSEDTSDNALYQIPVIKSGNKMSYGTYTVTITPMFSSGYDNAGNGSYDFYLDAIRVYDPANDGKDNAVVQKAYTDDKEGWPAYTEVRNMLIAKEDFYTADETTKGIIFIDGIPALDDSSESAISDYTNYGPNNEVYLSPRQAIAFKLNTGNDDIADVQVAVKGVNGEVSYKIYDAETTDITKVKSKIVKTATDLYESINWYEKIEELNGKTIVIANDSTTEGRILSITNIKVTFKSAPTAELDLSKLVEVDQEVAKVAMFSLRRSVVEDIPVEDDTTGNDSVTEDEVIEDNETPDVNESDNARPSYEEQVQEVVNAIVNVIKNAVNWFNNLFWR